MSYEMQRVVSPAGAKNRLPRTMFDPFSGLVVSGSRVAGNAKRVSRVGGKAGLGGYDDGLGWSFRINRNRFKFNKKSFTRPLKTVVKYAPAAAVLLPVASFIPGISTLVSRVPLVSRYTNLFHRGKKIVAQTKAAGLNLAHVIQPDGSTAVVATDSAGAIVSSYLPVHPDLVPPGAPVLPPNAVQAPAPPAVIQAAATAPAPDNSGITSLFDWLKSKDARDAATAQTAAQTAANAAANASGGGGGSSGGGGGGYSAPVPVRDPGASGVPPQEKSLLENPAVLVGAAALAYFAFRH